MKRALQGTPRTTHPWTPADSERSQGCIQACSHRSSKVASHREQGRSQRTGTAGVGARAQSSDRPRT
eukprot:12944794-Alexandrium_andersonii.AAC.1